MPAVQQPVKPFAAHGTYHPGRSRIVLDATRVEDVTLQQQIETAVEHPDIGRHHPRREQ